MVKEEADQHTTEAQLEDALKSRLKHFRDNASSLSLVGIRRLLEEDLGLEKYALDVHKSFIKRFIDKNLHADEDTDSKKSEGRVGEVISTVEKDKNLGAVSDKDEAKVEEDSPIMGVLTTKTETAGSSQGIEISESMIKKAIEERADYIRLQSEKLTLAGARRFLEEDLQLSKNSLDPFKKFIRQEIEKVIDSGVVSTSETVTQMGSSGNRQSNTAGSTSSEGMSGSIDITNNAEDHKAKPKEKLIRGGEAEKLDTVKKRKRAEKTTDVSGKKQNKLAKKKLEEDSDADNDNDRGVSEDDESQSAAEKPGKRKETPTSAYGKHVEHLKSVIKACGMSIGPTVYKKAKLVPESNREAFLIKELEGILLKEGLSKSPSEKEIKEVRKRKERAKELEGIDTSNIITSSRRRSSTMSFVPPPRPKKKDETGDDVVSTKKDKGDDKDANKMQEDDAKDAEKKEDYDCKDTKEKEDSHDEEEEDEEEEDDDDDEDDSQTEDFNDDDEGSG